MKYQIFGELKNTLRFFFVLLNNILPLIFIGGVNIIDLNKTDETGKCNNCGSRGTTFSTEQKNENWICKKICSSCNNVLEKEILELS